MDTLHPERNREVLVFRTNRLEALQYRDTETWHKGYLIFIPADPRWTKENPESYKAEIVSGPVVKLTVPALTYSFALDVQSIVNSNIPEDLKQSLQNYSFASPSEITINRAWKEIVLQFPNDNWLDIELAYERNNNMMGNATFGELVALPPHMGRDLAGCGHEHWMMFKVIRTDLAEERRESS